VQQRLPHARVMLMKIAVSVFRKRASGQPHNLDVRLYLGRVLADLPGLPPVELAKKQAADFSSLRPGRGLTRRPARSAQAIVSLDVAEPGQS